MGNSISFISHYFTQELIESFIFIIVGAISIFLSLFFLGIIKYSFFKGMAIPLLIIGSLQLSVGAVIYNRTPKDIIRVKKMMTQNKHLLQQEELPRMEVVLSNFKLYKWIEISLILVGLTLFITLKKPTQKFWKGIALGLIIQASITLTLDIVAENRANDYKYRLQNSIEIHNNQYR